MTPATKKPKVGDPVLFEGLDCKVGVIGPNEEGYPRLAAGFVAIDTNEMHTGMRKGRERTRPRFRHTMLLADMKWSDQLGAWYFFGRLLGKGRGGKFNERQVVIELRDRHLLPARPTRMAGQAPAPGEHINLAHLFRPGVDWAQEMANVRRGEGLSENARKRIEDYEIRFAQKLPEGYAGLEDDSWAD